MVLDALTGKVALWGTGALLAVVCMFAVSQTIRLADAHAALDREQRNHADERARIEQAAREQAERFRATEQGWTDAQRENGLIARKARDLVAQDVVAAAGAGGRLRERAAVVAAACRRTAEDSSAVAASPAASSPGDVLADVLGRLDEAGRQLAAYADAVRISAEQCVADYEALGSAPPSAVAAP